LAFRIDVGAEIARIEAQIFAQFHSWETVDRIAADVFVNPGHRHFEELGGLLHRQQFILDERDVLGLHGSPSVLVDVH
jgi:hypothetical protein